MALILVVLIMLAASLVADAAVRPRSAGPRPGRSLAGTAVHLLVVLAGFGLFLAASGHVPASALLTLALVAALALVSNAKNAVLGEPLLFSDFALIGAVVRHPQFYFSALRSWQIALLAGGAGAFALLLAWVFVPVAAPHLAGFLVLAAALAVLTLWSPLASVAVPDTDTDVQRHGLLATLVTHAGRWWRTPDPPACAEPAIAAGGAEIVVMVQCESFTDPADLFGDPSLALPGLAAARANAWRRGRLLVSGFGAYTMRTEYGVLFGRSEAALGFRRFDPFLTAVGEASHALPARLRAAGWRSLFVHPHDLGFYGRDRIMPAAGFDAVLGETDFAPPAPGDGRYVTDAALASRIIELARTAVGPTFLYAVTIENHGPWPPDEQAGGTPRSSAYLRLVRNSDAMLSALIAALGVLQRPALLVFFGDHRPSIPGLSDPGGDRTTPYVMVRFGADGRIEPGHGPAQDLSPADLHRALLAALSG